MIQDEIVQHKVTHIHLYINSHFIIELINDSDQGEFKGPGEWLYLLNMHFVRTQGLIKDARYKTINKP